LECEDRANHFANLGTIGACPVNEAAIHISGLPLAEIGKPESPVSVEHEIVGAAQRMLATVRISSLDLASVQIYELDAAALIVLTLQIRTEGAAFPDPGKPAVVADAHPAVGPQGSPVGSSANAGDHVNAAVRGDARKRFPCYLNEDNRSVRHGDRTFRKLQTRCDDFMLALKNASSLDVRCRQSVDHDVEARGQAAIQRAFGGWQ
jgi:hypothetical protein